MQVVFLTGNIKLDPEKKEGFHVLSILIGLVLQPDSAKALFSPHLKRIKFALNKMLFHEK